MTNHIDRMRAVLAVLIPFVRNQSTSVHLKNTLREIDLENWDLELQKEQRTSTVAAMREVNPVERREIMEGVKEQFHAENRHGKRCFDDRLHRELMQGIQVDDPGSPPFSANRDGRCAECRETILAGERIIIRQRGPVPV